MPFRNAEQRAAVEQLLLRPYAAAQMTYDLRRLRAKLEGSHRYVPTPQGTEVALVFTRSYERFVRPLFAINAVDAPPSTAPKARQAFRTIQRYIDDRAKEVCLVA